jgi:putative component of membrane protein insertase Oxa1/YidC/SpoIIIJ protein YidD
MQTVVRALLAAGIAGYRRLPASMKHPCPRSGATCSQLSLAAVRNGAGLAAVRAIIASCAPSVGRHEPTCDFPITTCSNWQPFSN